jgi:hypothetical protein
MSIVGKPPCSKNVGVCLVRQDPTVFPEPNDSRDPRLSRCTTLCPVAISTPQPHTTSVHTARTQDIGKEMSSSTTRSCIGMSQLPKRLATRQKSAPSAMALVCTSPALSRSRSTAIPKAELSSPTYVPRQRSSSLCYKRSAARPYPRALSPGFPNLSSRSLQTMVNSGTTKDVFPGDGRYIR